MLGIRVFCAEPNNEGGDLQSRSTMPPEASDKSKATVNSHSPRLHRVREAQKVQLIHKGIRET